MGTETTHKATPIFLSGTGPSLWFVAVTPSFGSPPRTPFALRAEPQLLWVLYLLEYLVIPGKSEYLLFPPNHSHSSMWPSVPRGKARRKIYSVSLWQEYRVLFQGDPGFSSIKGLWVCGRT